jgi:uncharacterized protein (TIGR03437 family)
LATAQDQIVVSNGASLIGTSTVAAGSIISIELIQPFGDFEALDRKSLNVTILPNGANFAEECGIVPPLLGQLLDLHQVIVVLPAILPLGPAQLTLYHSGLAVTAQIMIVPSSLGLFPPGLEIKVLQTGSDQVQRANLLTHPAQPGDTVMIWATGLGSATQVTVLLGGRATTSSFAGHVSYMPGLDQIQFVLPADPTIPNDCYVAVAAQVSGATTNAIWMSKTSDGSACQSTLGFTSDDLIRLDEDGVLGLAQLAVSAFVGAPPARLERQGLLDLEGASGFTRTESASFMPGQVNAAQAALVAGLAVADDVYFGCASSLPVPSDIGLVALLEPFNYGSQVTLRGADGTLYLVSPVPGGILFTGARTSPTVGDPSQLPPPFFTPGAWTFSGNGTPSPGSVDGPVPAPFSVPLSLPPEIMVTNFSALQTINRQQDLVVTWDPTGFGERDVLTVTLNENSSRAVFPSFGGLSLVTCKTPATNGQIVIPAALLQNLTPGKTGGPPAASVNLSVSSRSGPTQTFSLPYTSFGPTTPASSIHGILQFTSSENWPVTVE